VLLIMSIIGCAQIPPYYRIFSGNEPFKTFVHTSLGIKDELINGFGGAPFKWFFISVVITAVVLYLLVVILREANKIKDGTAYALKTALICVIVLVIVALPTVAAIFSRTLFGLGGALETSDGAVEAEGSVKALLAGQQPYGIEYPELVNHNKTLWRLQGYSSVPTANHCPYPPLALASSIPVYYGANALFGFFDLRMTNLLFLIGVIVLCLAQDTSRRNRLILLAVMLLNPFSLEAFVRGYKDCQVIFWLLLFLLALERKRNALAGLFLALALLTKQYVVMFVPFYFIYVSRIPVSGISVKNFFLSFADFVKYGYLFLLALLAGLVPFLIWDAHALYDNLFRILTHYPIKGSGSCGAGSLILYFGLVDNPSSGFPFWIPRLVIGLPAFIILAVRQARASSISALLESSLILIFVFFAFCSQAFHLNYLGFVIQLGVLSIALRTDRARLLPDHAGQNPLQ